jgi:outer membrane lipoprotein-sorting protein
LRPRVQTTLIALALVSLLSAGCAVSKKRTVPPAQLRPALNATASQLMTAYNDQARAVQTLNAAVRMSPVAGSAYSGVIQEYHDVGGFILAARPAMIRIIGQAPIVAKDIFDMVSDGRMFNIYIPSKKTFLVGSTEVERATKNPIENLRPQHILEALFWPELPTGAQTLFEEFNASPTRYYILTLLRPADSGQEIARKIWFDRTDLHVARLQIYGPAGRLDSDIAYADWQTAQTAPAATTTSSTTSVTGPLFPRQISITRPQQDYELSVSITRITLNAEIPPDRFVLQQPPGTQLVRVGETGGEAQP